MDAEIKFSTQRTKSCQMFSLCRPGFCKDICLHASLTAWNSIIHMFLISAFSVHLTSFFPNFSSNTVTALQPRSQTVVFELKTCVSA